MQRTSQMTSTLIHWVPAFSRSAKVVWLLSRMTCDYSRRVHLYTTLFMLGVNKL